MEMLLQVTAAIAAGLFLIKRFLPVRGISNINTQEAKNKCNDRTVQFIDVRTPYEYKTSHCKPFENVPLSELVQKSKGLDKDKEVIVICQSGVRSLKASKILKRQGFEKVTNVKGGMKAWI